MPEKRCNCEWPRVSDLSGKYGAPEPWYSGAVAANPDTLSGSQEGQNEEEEDMWSNLLDDLEKTLKSFGVIGY